jgi:hypothetical protein
MKTLRKILFLAGFAWMMFLGSDDGTPATP